MKYFIDTEFLEGTQKDVVKQALMRSLALTFTALSFVLFDKNTALSIIVAICIILLSLLFLVTSKQAKTLNTIDLISIGIVAEDGREYYAISSDFNLKEAWNRYDLKINKHYPLGPEYIKEYWIRENVLKPIFNELMSKLKEEDLTGYDKGSAVYLSGEFNYRNLKKLIKWYGNSNKQIAMEIVRFCNSDNGSDETWEYNEKYRSKHGEYPNVNSKPEFYAYYADYDWVAFCWLFGRMIDLPKGFPMYCKDLKQISDEIYFAKKQEYIEGGGRNFIDKMSNHLDYPKQTNEHNALADARWNYKLYKFLKSL